MAQITHVCFRNGRLTVFERLNFVQDTRREVGTKACFQHGAVSARFEVKGAAAHNLVAGAVGDRGTGEKVIHRFREIDEIVVTFGMIGESNENVVAIGTGNHG